MNNKRSKWSFTLLLVIPALIAACGDDDTGGADSAATTQSAPASVTEPATESTPAPSVTEPATESTPAPSVTESTPAPSADVALDDVIAAAQEEGSLLSYATGNEAIENRVIEAFSQKYGISVELFRDPTGVITRYTAEAEAGQVAADVVSIGSAKFLLDAIDKGWLLKIDDAEVPEFPGEFPAEYILDDGAYPVISIIPWGIAYNTDRVSADQLPTTWADLINPAFAGEIIVPNPASSDSMVQAWNRIRELEGDDFLEALGAQGIQVTEGGTAPSLEALGAGAAMYTVVSAGAAVEPAKARGAPLEMIYPDDTTGVILNIAISADAPHPNAARLYTHFVLSREGQELRNSDPGNVSPFDTSSIPSGYESPKPTAETDLATVQGLLGIG